MKVRILPIVIWIVVFVITTVTSHGLLQLFARGAFIDLVSIVTGLFAAYMARSWWQTRQRS